MKKNILFGMILPLTLTALMAAMPITESNTEAAEVITIEKTVEEPNPKDVTVETEKQNKPEDKNVEKQEKAQKTEETKNTEEDKENKEEDEQKKLVSSIKKGISKLYDSEKKELKENSKKKDADALLKKVKKVKNEKTRKSLKKKVKKVKNLIQKRNDEAEHAVRSMWNFEDGAIVLGTDWDDFNKAKELVDALPDSELKNDLTPALDAVEGLLTAQDEAEEQVRTQTDGMEGVGAEDTVDISLQNVEQDVNDIVPALDGRLGNSGRFYIPTVGINVALYQAELDDGYNQSVVDAQDAALLFPRACMSSDGSYNNDPIIADHRHQGFSGIKSVVQGHTKAYLYDENGNLSVYIAKEVITGHNRLSMITDEYGNNVECLGNDLMTYTCNDHWSNVTIVFWDCISGANYGASTANPNVTLEGDNVINL